MKLLFGKARWGADDLTLPQFLERVRKDGFDATEINIAGLEEPPEDVVVLHREYGLAHVSQLVITGLSVEEQLQFLDKWFPIAVQLEPLVINCHSGRDIFTFEDNLRVLRRIMDMGKEAQISVVHETHRSRALYSAVEARKYLEAFPDIRLNADFSHWMVVHESDLKDQPENITLAIEHSSCIHARVGFEQGPQVPHPAAPEWRTHLENHLALWRRIIESRKAAGQETLVITPEFGPVPYMPTLAFTNQPVADTWEVNTAMLAILKQELGTGA